MHPLARIARSLRRRLGRLRPVDPQLRMRLDLAEAPVVPPLPPGYRLQEFAPGDENRWVALLNGDGRGELGAWTLERLRAEVLAYLVPQTQWFVWRDAELAAAAGVYERSPAAWEVGWVATHPEHRGRGLGRAVVTAAVRSALSLPPRPVLLFTDDHREAAIRLYLRAGFVPDCHHPTHAGRWQVVLGRLGPRYGAPSAGPR